MSFISRLLAKTGLIVIESPAVAGHDDVDHDARTRPILEQRSLTLDELVRETRATNERQAEDLKTAATGLTVDLDAVLAAAGVTEPEHGWTVDRAADFVFDPERVHAGDTEQRRALTVQLAIERVPAEDIFRDAHARDDAADAYETFLRARVAELRIDVREQRDRLDRELNELQQRLERLDGESEAIEAALQDWLRKKRERERRWASTLQLLTPPGAPPLYEVSVSDDES